MLLDTHVWVWAAGDPRRLGPRTRRLLAAGEARARFYVSAASVFEVSALCTAGRLQLTQPLESWIRESIARGGLRVADVDMRVAVDAGLIPAAAIADPIDRLLVASARALALPLLTRDDRLLRYARSTRLLAVSDAGR